MLPVSAFLTIRGEEAVVGGRKIGQGDDVRNLEAALAATRRSRRRPP